MNQYEVLYLITPELDEEANRAVMDKFAGIITGNGGEIVKQDEWGKRKLAYAIDYKTEHGYPEGSIIRNRHKPEQNNSTKEFLKEV